MALNDLSIFSPSGYHVCAGYSAMFEYSVSIYCVTLGWLPLGEQSYSDFTKWSKSLPCMVSTVYSLLKKVSTLRSWETFHIILCLLLFRVQVLNKFGVCM